MRKNIVGFLLRSNQGIILFLHLAVIIKKAYENAASYLFNSAERSSVTIRDLINRFWIMKAEVDRRVAEIQNRQNNDEFGARS